MSQHGPHREALDLVRRGQIMWRAASKPATPDAVLRMPAGFAYSNRMRIDPSELLVALYELRDSKLLAIDGGVVLLTSAGRQRLSEWTAPQAVKR